MLLQDVLETKTLYFECRPNFGSFCPLPEPLRAGLPKLLVDRYPLDTVAGLHVPPKCCDVSLKQGGPNFFTLAGHFSKSFEFVGLSRVDIVPNHDVL